MTQSATLWEYPFAFKELTIAGAAAFNAAAGDIARVVVAIAAGTVVGEVEVATVELAEVTAGEVLSVPLVATR